MSLTIRLGSGQWMNQTSKERPPSYLAIASALLVLYGVWGSTYLAIRVTLETLPPFLMAGSRFVIAGVVLGAIALGTNSFRASWRQWRESLITSSLMLLAGNGLVCWAVQEVPSGIATLMVSANPFLFVLSEWIISCSQSRLGRGDKPTIATLIGLSSGFAGLCLLLLQRDSYAGMDAIDIRRLLAILLACVCWTIGSLYTKYSSHSSEPLAGSAMQMLCGGFGLLVTGFAFGEWATFDWKGVSSRSIYAWIYLVVAGSLIAYTTYLWAMKHCSPTLVSTYAYVNPVVAVFLGWWLLDEVIGPRTILAGSLIVAGVIIISWSKFRARATSNSTESS